MKLLIEGHDQCHLCNKPFEMYDKVVVNTEIVGFKVDKNVIDSPFKCLVLAWAHVSCTSANYKALLKKKLVLDPYRDKQYEHLAEADIEISEVVNTSETRHD